MEPYWAWGGFPCTPTPPIPTPFNDAVVPGCVNPVEVNEYVASEKYVASLRGLAPSPVLADERGERGSMAPSEESYATSDSDEEDDVSASSSYSTNASTFDDSSELQQVPESPFSYGSPVLPPTPRSAGGDTTRAKRPQKRSTPPTPALTPASARGVAKAVDKATTKKAKKTGLQCRALACEKCRISMTYFKNKPAQLMHELRSVRFAALEGTIPYTADELEDLKESMGKEGHNAIIKIAPIQK